MHSIKMRCSQENWNKIEPILIKNKAQIANITSFANCPFLINDFNTVLGRISNVSSPENSEPWDQNKFLRACGIEVENDSFVLPDKWCVKRNLENYKVINDWLNKGVSNNMYINKDGYIHYPNYFDFDAFILGCHASVSIKDGYTEITFEQFKKYVLKQEDNMSSNNKDSRFPFKLQPNDAKIIINIACTAWKNKLAENWAKDIVLNIPITISEEFYKRMRSECTNEQNLLFDTIFGKDIKVDFSILNDTDVFYIKSCRKAEYVFKGANPFNGSVKGYNYNTNLNFINTVCNKKDVVELRLATKVEIELYKSHYPDYQYKDGDLVWVKMGNQWYLRYTNGKIIENRLECYENQKKSGYISTWNIYKPAIGIKLPD